MRSLISAVAIALVLACVAPAAVAQLGVDVHRLEIRDGKVFHDGVELPPSALPDDFEAAGVSFTFEYSGPVMPAITLNGRVYALEGDRLVSIEETASEDGARAVAMMSADPASADERRRQAEEAYLQTLSERDRVLYERLMTERDMEEESLRVAYAARRAGTAEERRRLIDQLRTQLGQIFDLKQENRRDEIQQVETLLEVMERQMQEREAQREALIEQRIRELVGEN